MLEEGAVYIDSGGDRGSLEIHTRLGVLRDIGTRFEVRLGAAALRIRVRDGLVELRHDRDSHQAKRGDELTVDATGKVARRSVPVFGSDWEWAVTVAPLMSISHSCWKPALPDLSSYSLRLP